MSTYKPFYTQISDFPRNAENTEIRGSENPESTGGGILINVFFGGNVLGFDA